MSSASLSKSKYTLASQTELNNGVLDVEEQYLPDKTRRSCIQTCALYSCFLGFACILTGIVCAFVMKPVIEGRIRRNLALDDGGEAFNKWKEPPVTPVLFYYVFNLTNEEEFLAGREKPKLEELGPYAYNQKMVKTAISFDGVDIVGYSIRTVYTFAPEKSERDEDWDEVIVPNIPLFGAMLKLQEESQLTKAIFKRFVESYDFGLDNKKPFLKMTVKDFLWGYPSLIVSLARETDLGCKESGSNQLGSSSEEADMADWDDFNAWGFDYEANTEVEVVEEPKEEVECDLSPGNLSPFGLLYSRNNTDVNPREIITGVSNLTQKGIMVSWKDMRRLNYWLPDSHCNSLEGSRDAGGMPLDLGKDQTLKLFLGQVGRNIDFKYSKEVRVMDFHTYRFEPLVNTFDSAEDNPDNWCYCINDPCLPSGILDISTAEPGSPILISWPHFLHADPELRQKVEGMRPDPAKHSFYFDILPEYGITLSALARLQLNVELVKDSGFGYFDNITEDKVFLPFGWLEEGLVEPSEEMADSVTLMLTLPSKAKKLAGFFGILIGFILLIPEIIFWIRSCCRGSPSEKTASFVPINELKEARNSANCS